MPKPNGYGVYTGFYGEHTEVDTITCGHCQFVIFVKPGSGSTVYLVYNSVDPRLPPLEEPGAFCRVCMRPVCLACHARGNCTPFERMLEAAEARDRFCRSAGLIGA